MRIKIRSPKTGEILNAKIEDVIELYERFLYKTCHKWIRNFSFDQSIDLEDLVQEIKIKLFNSLHYYDYEIGDILPYIAEISKNFFLNKRLKMVARNSFPTNGNGNPTGTTSLSTPIMNNGAKTELIEMIQSTKDFGDDYELKRLKDVIRRELDEILYNPKGFFQRKRSFVRVVFDLLDEQNEKFLNEMLFMYRCKLRASMAEGSNLPNTARPTVKMIGEYLGVNHRAVNYAYGKIRKVIREHLMN